MCIPVDSPYYEWSHGIVYDYICDTMGTEYRNFCTLPPADDSDVYVVHILGKHLRTSFPHIDASLKYLFPFDPIRRMSTYAVVVRTFEEGEIYK